MAKGKPDPEHELVVTSLSRCLKLAYPQAELSQGGRISSLNLKPDIYVAHADGRRWAYEVVNKNAGVAKIEANHEVYAQAGVQDYWILWEASGPDKPLDDSMLAQSVWVTDEVVEGKKQYELKSLHRVLAKIGDGALYVFGINKPMLDRAGHWALKLGMIGMLLYEFCPHQPGEGYVSGDFELVPLPLLTFDEHGKPVLKPDAVEIPAFLQGFAAMPSDRPVFFPDILTRFDALLESPDILANLFRENLAQLGAQYGDQPLPESERLATALQKFQRAVAEIAAKPVREESDMVWVLEALDILVAALPDPFQRSLREAVPVTGAMLRQVLEIKQWFEGDEHLRALLDAE